jgi:hypothetical protein
MAHVVILEDAHGDAADANYYCSDYCATGDDAYAGWNGCHTPPTDTTCGTCGAWIWGEDGAA